MPLALVVLTMIFCKFQLKKLQERATALKMDFTEREQLDKIVQRTERWCEEARVAVSLSPDMKRLQNLLNEAGSIPVDLSEQCAELNGKVEQAHKWVEKVSKQVKGWCFSFCALNS